MASGSRVGTAGGVVSASMGVAQGHTLATARRVAHFTSHGMNKNCKYTLNVTCRLEYQGSRY